MSRITHHLKITGMTCGGCSSRLKSVLTSTNGIFNAEISHQNNSGIIIADSEIETQTIIAVVESAGFGVLD
tara:strand:- start:84 stop:296 length:213 start_codon:yes stop_codon:yes gene_type:complete